MPPWIGGAGDVVGLLLVRQGLPRQVDQFLVGRDGKPAARHLSDQADLRAAPRLGIAEIALEGGGAEAADAAEQVDLIGAEADPGIVDAPRDAGRAVDRHGRGGQAERRAAVFAGCPVAPNCGNRSARCTRNCASASAAFSTAMRRSRLLASAVSMARFSRASVNTSRQPIASAERSGSTGAVAAEPARR